jgi:hypothetical protein
MSAETTPNHIMSASAFDFQRDLGRYWRFVRKHGELTLTQQGWVYKSSFKAVLAALNMTDSPAEEQTNGKVWFMRRLLTAMHEFVGNNFDHQLTANANSKLLGMSTAQRVKWAFDTWRDSGAWNELVRLPVPYSGVDVRRESAAALGKARIVVLRAISRLASGNPNWLPLTSLINQLKKNEYQFLFERRHRTSYGGLYTSPYYGPNNPYGITFTTVKDEASGWNVVEYAFIVHILTGPLHWLGLVELGYDNGQERGENHSPSAFRLTEAGAWVLGLGEQPQFAESGGRLIVQPNFTILALEPISDVVLTELDQFAESRGGERAIAYELTKESLYRGQQMGWDAARVMQFLESHQGAPIPTNIRRTLDEWETSHRRITFHRNMCVVQFADDDAQAESRAAISAFQTQTLGEHFVLVEKRSAGEVVTALREAGWVPTLQLANDTASEAVLRATDDGEVLFTQPAPSVHALGKLAQFSAPAPLPPGGVGGGGGSVNITSDSIRAAMSVGMNLDQLLATLAELHSGPVPRALEQKIRAWASFFGTAKVQLVTLLELSNFDVLTNLANDPQVGKYLTPIEGAVSPMALVDATYADYVMEQLRERGITVL